MIQNAELFDKYLNLSTFLDSSTVYYSSSGLPYYILFFSALIHYKVIKRF